MDIKTASLEQLKVAAYDIIVVIEKHQAMLQQVNQEISSRSEKEEPKEEVKK